MRVRTHGTLFAYLFRIPLASPYKLSFGTISEFETIYIYLESESHTGFGEITPLPGYSPETIDICKSSLWNLKASLETGRPLFGELKKMMIPTPMVASGVACAYETWAEGPGTACHIGLQDGIPLAAHCSGDSPEETGKTAHSLVKQGFRTLKVKVGATSPLADSARIKAAASELTEGCRIRIDANKSYNLAEALTFCKELEGVHSIELIEQPFPVEQWNENEKLAARTSIPIMLDESIWTNEDVRRAADHGIKYVKLKLCKHLGMRGVKGIAHKASQYGMHVVLGNGVQTALGNHLEARLHFGLKLLSAAENNGFLKPIQNPVEHGMQVQNGQIIDRGLRRHELEKAASRGRLLLRVALCLEN